MNLQSCFGEELLFFARSRLLSVKKALDRSFFLPRAFQKRYLLELPADAQVHTLISFMAGGLHTVVQTEAQIALFGLHTDHA